MSRFSDVVPPDLQWDGVGRRSRSGFPGYASGSRFQYETTRLRKAMQFHELFGN